MSNLIDRIARLSPEQRAILERKLLTQHAPVISTIPRRADAQSFELSFGQQRLWFCEQFQPGNIAYNYGECVRFFGALNVPALEQSVQEIVRRHEALRTVFRITNGAPVQQIMPPQPIHIPITAIRNLSELRRGAHINEVLRRDNAAPLDLEQSPLFSMKLLRFDDQDHALLLSTHHIIFDGWSYGVFVRELMTLYRALSEGKRSPLPELPIQYGDFAEWQRERMQGAFLNSELEYWRKQLAGVATLALPIDKPRPPVQTFNGKHATLSISPELTAAVRAFCRKERATLFMVLLAGFKALLHRYSGQDDIAVGTPIAGRTRSQLENLIGLFVNMLVLRTDTSGNPTFSELLGRVRDVCLDAYAHQELPFDKLVEALQPERSPDRSPFFQVNFILQNTPKPSVDIPNLQVSLPGAQQNGTRFDLTLDLTEEEDTIRAVIEYNTDLFEDATIQRMLGHFETLLRGAVLYPTQRIDALPLLTERERKQILDDWNQTHSPYPQDQTIHALFEAQAARTPESIALTFGADSLTYAQLNARANTLAAKLREMGVAPGVQAGICVERSAEMIIAVLAVLKAGGAYVPMDPQYPVERLEHMIADARMPILLTQTKLAGNLPVGNANILNLDDMKPWSIASAPTPESTPNDVAYCIYTSGSTGKPKGVQITHRAVVNFLHSMRTAPGICDRDILLSVTTLSFDICGLEMFLPLMAGARIVLAGREDIRDAKMMMNRIASSDATIMQATPSMWRMLLDAGWRGKPGLKALCGGEPLPVKLAEQLIAARIELWNMYGPTETTIWSSVKRIDRADQISIGRPIANTQMYVLNAAREPAPIGVTGELYIGGDGVARGYLNRPDLNAERFVPDPFNSQPQARMYKTGDLARFLPNGEIQHLGRSDHQVKIRGHRIELGEIETALGKHPSVRENVVVAIDDGSGGQRLAAYIAPKSGETLNAADVRAHLEKCLPEIMIPAVFMFLAALPLTPNGKVDRKALPPPEIARGSNESTYLEPRSETERALAEIWSAVLRVPRIGVNDNFFELGGHSLLVFQILSRIRDELGCELPVRSLFESPTVARLAEMIETVLWANAASEERCEPTGVLREESEI